MHILQTNPEDLNDYRKPGSIERSYDSGRSHIRTTDFLSSTDIRYLRHRFLCRKLVPKFVEYLDRRKNSGIFRVKTSCGCTVPQWTQKPVPPGKTGEIQIKYDTSHPGTFSKTITVFYNGEDSPQVLPIKGSVKYPEE